MAWRAAQAVAVRARQPPSCEGEAGGGGSAGAGRKGWWGPDRRVQGEGGGGREAEEGGEGRQRDATHVLGTQLGYATVLALRTVSSPVSERS